VLFASHIANWLQRLPRQWKKVHMTGHQVLSGPD
jgi:hypothetical protein